MNVSLTFIERVASEFRRLPLWFYLLLLCVGGVVVYNVHNQHARSSEAAADYQTSTNELLRSPIAGVIYQFHVYQYAPTKRLLQFNRPLTTSDSYSIELEPTGSDCSETSIESVQIDILSPAFAIDPPDRVTRRLQLLRQNYCVATPKEAAVTNYHWEALARQEGHHVLSLRIIGLDSQGNKVSEDMMPLPMRVSNPMTFAATAGALTGLGGLLGTLLTLSHQFIMKPNRRGPAQRQLPRRPKMGNDRARRVGTGRLSRKNPTVDLRISSPFSRNASPSEVTPDTGTGPEYRS